LSPSEEPPEEPSGTPKGGGWTGALRDAAPYLGLGTTLAGSVLLGLGLGYWLDSKLGTRPAFFLVGAVMGLLAAGLHFYRMLVIKKR
jgi:F0F1-type ATP synthase assembly protein I